jgi:Fe-S-cluster containining protein
MLCPTTLPHLRTLGVSPRLLEARFASECRIEQCDASCCRIGVRVDIGERDQIIAHARPVQDAMDPDQERDPGRWFEADAGRDSDYPSGWSVRTRTLNGHCVFLNAARRCVLQGAGVDLKPFFCAAYPVTIVDGTLTIEDDLTDRVRCCRPVPDGALTVFDVCARELTHVLGPDGVRALCELSSAGPYPDEEGVSPPRKT